MKIVKKLLSCVCATAFVLSAAVLPLGKDGQSLLKTSVAAGDDEPKTYQGFTYHDNYDRKTVILDFYDGTDKHVRIPNSINGKKVYRISKGTFWYNENVEEITIPKDLQEIPEGSFAGCVNLKRINCTQNPLFEFKSKILYADVDYGSSFTINGMKSPQFVYKKIVLFCCSDSSYVTVDDGVDKIGDHAFEGREKLTHVVLPTGLQVIGESAFENCVKLRGMSMTQTDGSTSEFNIPYGTLYIDDYAFCGCEEIRGVSLPDTIWGVGRGAFLNCPKLRSIYCPDSLKYISDTAFSFKGSKTGMTADCSFAFIDGAEEPEDGSKTPAQQRAGPSFNYSRADAYQPPVYDENGWLISGFETGCTHNPDNDYDHCYVFAKGIVPTCTAPGAMAGICYCGHTFYYPLPATGHRFSITKINDDGTTDYKCAVCGETKTVGTSVSCIVSAMHPKFEYADSSKIKMELYDENGEYAADASASGSGAFAFEGVKAGTYNAVIKMEGYAPRTEKITVGNGQTGLDLKLCKYGDTNGDGNKNLKDLVLMKRRLANWDVQYVYDETADTNVDGKHNLKDMVLLQRDLNKWDVAIG